ncbi:MAG: hypothetical protein ACRDRK_18315 [Pseudonocardia sp.]
MSAGGIVYDTGALVAAERADDQVWFVHRRALGRGLRPVVPSVVLAQAWRGGPQPNLSRLLKGCVIEALAENAAREVGRLLTWPHSPPRSASRSGCKRSEREDA